MKNNGSWKTYLAIAVLLLGGLLFFISGLVKFTQVNSFPQTNALITQIEWEPGTGDEADTYKVFVRYSVGGTTYDEELDNYKSSYREGQTITIRYNPDKPESITGLSTPVTIIITAVGCIFLAGGVLTLTKFLRGRREALSEA